VLVAALPLVASGHPVIQPPYTYAFFWEASAAVSVEGAGVVDGSYAMDDADGWFSLRIVEPVVEQVEVEFAELHLEGSYDVAGVVFDLVFTLSGHAHGTLERSGGDQFVAWYSLAEDMRATGTVTCIAGSFVCTLAGLPDGSPVAIDSTWDADLTDFALTPTANSTGGMSWVLPFVPESLGQHTLTIHGTEQSSELPLPLPEPSAAWLLGLAAAVIGGLRRRGRSRRAGT
jgi:hypothetical protein